MVMVMTVRSVGEIYKEKTGGGRRKETGEKPEFSVPERGRAHGGFEHLDLLAHVWEGQSDIRRT